MKRVKHIALLLPVTLSPLSMVVSCSKHKEYVDVPYIKYNVLDRAQLIDINLNARQQELLEKYMDNKEVASTYEDFSKRAANLPNTFIRSGDSVSLKRLNGNYVIETKTPNIFISDVQKSAIRCKQNFETLQNVYSELCNSPIINIYNFSQQQHSNHFDNVNDNLVASISEAKLNNLPNLAIWLKSQTNEVDITNHAADANDAIYGYTESLLDNTGKETSITAIAGSFNWTLDFNLFNDWLLKRKNYLSQKFHEQIHILEDHMSPQESEMWITQMINGIFDTGHIFDEYNIAILDGIVSNDK